MRIYMSAHSHDWPVVHFPVNQENESIKIISASETEKHKLKKSLVKEPNLQYTIFARLLQTVVNIVNETFNE